MTRRNEAGNKEDDEQEALDLLEYNRWRQQRDLREEVERVSMLKQAAEKAGQIKALFGVIGGGVACLVAGLWNVFVLNQQIKDNSREIGSVKTSLFELQSIVKENRAKIETMDRDVDFMKRTDKSKQSP